MNRNVKIAIGVILGATLLYLGYRYLYKKSDTQGVNPANEKIVYNKAQREVVLVNND